MIAMKRVLCLLLALLLFAPAIPVTAEETPGNYPAVQIDPDTGKPYDFEGKTVFIYLPYAMDDWEKNHAYGNEELYQYRMWLQKTYNCKIAFAKLGDFMTYTDKAVQFCKNPKGKLGILLPFDTSLAKLLQANVLADWKKSTLIDLSDPMWDATVTKWMTINGGVYGIYPGVPQGDTLLYFNKDVLKKAKIDWESIYDMQANGTWTWDKLESMLKKINALTKKGAKKKIWPISASEIDLYTIAVFSNGGDFFHFNSKKQFVVGASAKKTVEALKWGKNLYKKYAYQPVESDSWDYANARFKEGSIGFYVGSVSQGFSVNPEFASMKGEWGCVAFPKGPQGKQYAFNQGHSSVYVTSKAYDQKTLSMLSMILDMWTRDVPGVQSASADPAAYYDHTDKRAVDETFPMTRQGKYIVSDLTLFVGSRNDVLAVSLLWNLESAKDVEKLAKQFVAKWKKDCAALNKAFAALQ